MTLLLVSFIAGALTVLAPCILPLLPVVIGTSAAGRGRATPFVVVGSLAVSIVLFTFLLKASTALIDVPQAFWTGVSGGVLILFGLTLVVPSLWSHMPGVSRASVGANTALGTGFRRKNAIGDVIMGAALGPIFSTCSPTYFVILATVLPVSFAKGTLYLCVYVLGLSLMLLAIAFLGQTFATRLAAATDAHGRVKKVIGGILIVVGILIATGYEKKIETALLESGWLDVTRFEHLLLERTEAGSVAPTPALADVSQCAVSGSEMCADMDRTALRDAIDHMKPLTRYREIVSPTAFLNTNDAALKLGDNVADGNVVLIDFITYSCANCRAVIPHLNDWYAKYQADGLVVVGIHAPEFAFEHDRKNVEDALTELNVTFPVVMDNEFATWHAYGNRFWPHLYLIDRNGDIVYDHVGEGNYEETEQQIRAALGLHTDENAP